MSFRDIESELNEMQNKLDVIIRDSNKIGTFEDNAGVRNEIQNNVKTLMTLSQSAKKTLTQLKQNDVPNVDQYQARFDNLSIQMKNNLPEVIQKFKQSAPQFDQIDSYTNPTNDFNQSLLPQEVIENQSDQLDELSAQVNGILSAMREVHELFTETYEELQKQKHMLFRIETTTDAAREDMLNGNKQLDKAHENQKSSTRSLIWIFLILGVIIVGIVIFCSIYFTKKK